MSFAFASRKCPQLVKHNDDTKNQDCYNYFHSKTFLLPSVCDLAIDRRFCLQYFIQALVAPINDARSMQEAMISVICG